MSRHIIPLVIVALLTLAAHAQPDHPWASQPYLGLSVRDSQHGPVVGWVYPGPLGGQSFTSSSGIQRGDNLVSINNQPIETRDDFKRIIDALAPGDEITIVYRRSPEADMNASIPIGGPGGDETTLTVTLSSKDEWSGTIGRLNVSRNILPLSRSNTSAYEDMIRDRAQALGVMDPDDGLGALIEHLRKVEEESADPLTPLPITLAFRHPLALDAVAERIDAQIAPLRKFTADWGRIEEADALRAGLGMFLERPLVKLAQPKLEPASKTDMQSLVRTMNESWSIDPAQAEQQIRTIRSMARARPSVIECGDLFRDHFDQMYDLRKRQQDGKLGGMEFVDATKSRVFREYVTGLIVDDSLHNGAAVVGGPGDNTYDMSRLVAVIDVGGNDTYIWPEGIDTSESFFCRIIDLGGNDTYRSESDFAGPGVARGSVAIVDDLAGNDTYISTGLASMAAGIGGTGIIIDRAGDDTYTNTGPNSGWSQGVGFYGIGLIIDCAGRDVYHAEKLSQGVGGPGGFGAIIDGGGNDLYQANGPNYGSAYGTPGVYLGMSQGFGFGIRGYAAGGVGLIDDMSGNDQYIAGEFSQAGGYYYGLGLIRDHAGHDLYHANRYGQAFAAHQAVGILIDDAGDDTYWSMTAASQSGVWDESITLLLDKAGNDAYRCDGLGIGAASMQAIGIFIDLEGNDRYSANPGATLGQSGSNTYHYDAAGVMSFSAFFDLGNGNDTYPSKARSNNQSKSTGKRNESEPEKSSLYGVFVDE